MKSIFNKIHLYWKCQVLGWAGFLIVVTIFNELVYHDTNEFLPFGVSIYIFGLLFSHLMKVTINKLGILKKKFAAQTISLSILSILISFFGTLIWMIVMIAIGFWKVEGDTQSAQVADFLHEYFFHLFLTLLSLSGWVLIYFLYHYVQGVRSEEQLKTAYQLRMTEMEAKALRAQMNPHFIFNCMNSIKSLMQENKIDKGVIYLTTFSKLIRSLFNNADKKEISLYDEIETCKLYLQLEAMRFDTKFSYEVKVDENLDMKSVTIPALIIQPFIENAIWHGIVPKGEAGHVELSVLQKDNFVEIIIDDNGIGREASKQNKSASAIIHNSKGVNLTQSRLELDNLLRQRQAQMEIIDKENESGVATGTKVIITIKEEVS